jgi:DNA-binding LacI/PurR family transcriptional regulator
MRGEEQEVVAVRDAVVGAFCLYCMPDTHPAVTAAMARGVPVVIVDEPRSPGSFFVGIDDHEGARQAAAHVKALGHERVAILVDRLVDDGYEGLADVDRIARSNCKVARERVAGYVAGLDSTEPVPVYDTLGNFEEPAARGARELLALDRRPTALLCATDVLAFGAMRAARELGLDVPGDVSITGFDDVPHAAAVGLTTVRQPLVEKGREAGRLLMEQHTEREVVLPLELVPRGSTAPPPA